LGRSEGGPRHCTLYRWGDEKDPGDDRVRSPVDRRKGFVPDAIPSLCVKSAQEKSPTSKSLVISKSSDKNTQMTTGLEMKNDVYGCSIKGRNFGPEKDRNRRLALAHRFMDSIRQQGVVK